MSDADGTTPPAPETPPEETPPVEIHKPKLIHNLREFLKEVGIIVLGVSIALAGEQAVEHWRAHQQYLADRQAMRTELALGITNISRRNGFASCIALRLDD